jgi:hypothetical protein
MKMNPGVRGSGQTSATVSLSDDVSDWIVEHAAFDHHHHHHSQPYDVPWWLM